MKVIAEESFGADLEGESFSFAQGKEYEVSEIVFAEYGKFGWLKATQSPKETTSLKKTSKAQ